MEGFMEEVVAYQPEGTLWAKVRRLWAVLDIKMGDRKNEGVCWPHSELESGMDGVPEGSFK